MLAPYAMRAEDSKGRVFNEDIHKNRNCYQHDRDRIIHSQAFRRLEYKTQVFVNHEGDHFRTRLTHSLEVAQIARTIAYRLKINSDLAEFFALAHDLGHPPFGHAGERALNKAMERFGGFDHNVNSFKIVTKLEQCYADFDGLNLTQESLEGLAKHNGPLKKLTKSQKYLVSYNNKFDLRFKKYAGLEAQISALADDIAYNNHDIDDGFRAGLLRPSDFAHIKILDDAFTEVQMKYPDLEQSRVLYEVLRRIYSLMVDDLVNATTKNLTKFAIKSVHDVENNKEAVADFSEFMNEQISLIRDLLYTKIYSCPSINRMTYKADIIIKDLFSFFMEHNECLNLKLQEQIDGKKEIAKAEIICDYIAGMTDRFAISKHNEIFDLHSDDQRF